MIPVVRDMILKGELLETMAQWAVHKHDTRTAMELLSQARSALGDTPVLSWFSVRFLEAQVQAPLTPLARNQLFDEVDAMIGSVSDVNLSVALRLAEVRIAWEQGDTAKVGDLLDQCTALLPSIGGTNSL